MQLECKLATSNHAEKITQIDSSYDSLIIDRFIA